MSYLFYDCESLSSLPDISNWNNSNVTNMNRIFDNIAHAYIIARISIRNIR